MKTHFHEQAARVLPVQIEAGVQHAVVTIEVPTNPLEEGTLSLDVTLTGAHGAPASAVLEREVVLTPPVIDMAVLCDERGEAEELRFGMEVWFGARVISTRPLLETVVTIEQEGWRSTAPRWTPGESESSPSPSCAAQVPDDEHAVMIKDVNEVVKNIDELETSLGFGMKENNAKPFNKGVKSEIDSSGE